MNRSELINDMAVQSENSEHTTAVIVKTILGAMSDTLVKGDGIEIRGFGSFSVKNYGSYVGRNPKTGERIDVGPKKLPFFKVGKDLRERVDLEWKHGPHD